MPATPKIFTQRRIIYLILLLVLLVGVYHPLFSFNEVVASAPEQREGNQSSYSEYVFSQLPISIVAKKALFEEHSLPLWSKWTWGGTPYLGIPGNFLFYPGFLLFVFLPTPEAVLNYSLFFHVLLAAAGAYLLGSYLFKSEESALISALVFSASGIVLSSIVNGSVVFVYGIAFVPWLYLFLFKSIREPQKLGYAVLAALTLALQFYSGMIQFFMYDLLLVPFFYLFFWYPKKDSITGKKEWKKPLLKVGFFCAIIFLLTLGLIAPKLLPNMDFIAISGRQTEMPLEQFPGLFREAQNIWNYLVQGEEGWVNDLRGSPGLIPFILALFSVWGLKERREAKWFWILILVSIALVSASPLYRLVMSLPGFTFGWFTSRFLVYYALPVALLSGLGATILIEKVSERISQHIPWKNKQLFLYLILLLLVFVNLKFFNPELQMEQGVSQDIPALSYLETQRDFEEEPFRVTNAQETWLEREVAYYYLPYNLEGLYGYDGTLVWIPEYVVALHSLDYFDEIRAIFNARYVLSAYDLGTSGNEGLKLVFKSNESCSICRPTWAGGPYVYENEYALPRASFFPKAILIVGDKDKKVTNSILSHPDFNPRKTLLVEEPSINGKSFSELNRYEAIILANFNLEELPQEELQKYHPSGGKLFPNVLNQSANQKYNLSSLQKQMGKLMNTSKSQMVPVKHLLYKNNERTYNLNNLSKGFLVLSEKFYMFPNDWKESEGRTLLKADGGITAIWIDAPSEVNLKYRPATLNIGLLLLALAVLWIILLLILQKVYSDKLNRFLS